MNKKRFKKKDFITYWKRKYFYFFISCLVIWYFLIPNTNNHLISLHILPLDIFFGYPFTGFFELGLFKFLIFNIIGMIGLYAISVTLFIFVTGADFWDKGDFQDEAFRWIVGLKDSSEQINFKTIWTRKKLLKEKKMKNK